MVLPAIVLTGLAACGSDSKSSDTASGGQSSTSAPAVTTATTAVPVVTTQAAAVLKAVNNDKFGSIAVDAAGKSLYMFDNDTSPTSTCTGTCAQTWPPLLIPAGGSTPVPNTGITGTLTLSARSEGGSQIVLNGKPLYRYSGDSNPGDTNGDGVAGKWHIAKLS